MQGNEQRRTHFPEVLPKPGDHHVFATLNVAFQESAVPESVRCNEISNVHDLNRNTAPSSTVSRHHPRHTVTETRSASDYGQGAVSGSDGPGINRDQACEPWIQRNIIFQILSSDGIRFECKDMAPQRHRE